MSSRKRSKYPALNPNLNLKIRAKELGDIDYLDKLNDSEKAWLNKFMSETVNADFRHKNPILKGKKRRREMYKRNNIRNKDVYSIAESQGKIAELGSSTPNLEVSGFEDMMIKKIDLEKKFKRKNES